MNESITLSVIKADVGGYVGHSAMHPALIEEARQMLEEAQAIGKIVDFHVTFCATLVQVVKISQVISWISL